MTTLQTHTSGPLSEPSLPKQSVEYGASHVRNDHPTQVDAFIEHEEGPRSTSERAHNVVVHDGRLPGIPSVCRSCVSFCQLC